jgi:exodeoxyribonuclease VII large subunit
VIAVGPIQIYQARGTYQLMIEQLVPVGLGALELAFRQLQEKLAREGLFAPERKRPIPRFPRRIALVTSPTSAAVRDLLQVITRRWSAADVVIVPVPVQGEGAAERIASALRTVHCIPGVDVVITGRGGGSLEDLWAFNEEIVARAVHGCRVPVICAIGHEIDVSIADLVADRRALTPSEAGELAVPLLDEVLAELRYLRDRLAGSLRERAHRARLRLDALASRRVLARPRDALRDRIQRLDELQTRLCRAMRERVRHDRRVLESSACSLDALSPLKVLRRGYSITQRSDTGEVIRSGAQLSSGDTITTLLADVRVTSRVESVALRESSAGESQKG